MNSLHQAPVCYEIFIRSFCDSNGDGIGDLNGIRLKLPYLKDLGIGGIWLTPMHPSPSYHKYDVTDYRQIDPEYGTLEDFRALLSEARRLGIRVYMDLVIHHTSIFHPWFEKARKYPDSKYRSYYRWLDENSIRDLGLWDRKITDDTHTRNPWHKAEGNTERYFGIFSPFMADLNFDNLEVRVEVREIASFWLNEIGVDGFRLDAARHIYPPWEDEKNPEYWKEFGKVVKELKSDTYLIGEVWTSTLKVAPYFQGLAALFNFDLCLKLEDVLVNEKDNGLVSWLTQQHRVFQRENKQFIDAIMLSNHDQQRIGSTLKGNTAKLKLAAALLLTLPGQPYLYYGEELGMLGRKPDPYIREPFLWGDDAMDTYWQKARYSRASKVASLRDAKGDPASLYYCYKCLISLRNRLPGLGAVAQAVLRPVHSEHPAILVYKRGEGAGELLVVHNLSSKTREFRLKDELAEFQIVLYAGSPAFTLNASHLRLGRYNSLILSKKVQ